MRAVPLEQVHQHNVRHLMYDAWHNTEKNTHLRLEVMYDPPTKISIFTNFVTRLAWTLQSDPARI